MGRTYPYPIIFGYKNRNKPFPVINVITEEGGVQKFFSRTNYNLFLDDPADAETLRVGHFLKCLGKETDKCAGCRRDDRFCPLFIEAVESDVPIVKRKTEEFLYTSKNFVTLHKQGWTLEWESCPVAQFYLQLTDTPAERCFLERYLEYAAIQCNWPSDFEPADIPIVPDHQFGRADLPSPRYANYARAWNYGQKGAPGRYFSSLWDFSRKLLDLLVHPALIPQVWLNSIFHPELGPTDPEKEYLDEHPSRVDFLMLEGGRRHVIEIDDPGHYAASKDAWNGRGG